MVQVIWRVTADMQDWTEQGVLVPLWATLAAFDEEGS